MRRLTTIKTHHIINALFRNNRKPLQKLIRQLLKDGTNRRWSDVEVLLLKAIEFTCLKHGFAQDAYDIIRITGFDMLLQLPESTFQTAVDLVEGDETFALEAFSGIADAIGFDRLNEAQSEVLLRAADKALELGKENVALCIYRTALKCEAHLDSKNTHPFVIAATTNNKLLGQAYCEAFDECTHLRFSRYEKGYLEDLVLLGNAHFVELTLKCNANVHTPTSDGQSLLDIAPNAEVRELLLQYGGQPTDRQIYLLRQAILSIENGGIDHGVMQKIFSYPKPLLRHSYYETTHPTASSTTWDLVFKAAKCRCVPALKYILPYLKDHCTDNDLDDLLRALFGTDTLASSPRDAQSAKQIIAVLELLVSHGISYIDPWKMDNEIYWMRANNNSKVAQLLDFACNIYRSDSEYPDEDFVKMAMLLWKIGNIYGTVEGGREMLLLGINKRKPCLLEACLAAFECDFSLLDTDYTSCVWNIVGNDLGKTETVRDLLNYAIENGADINHQTADGLSALHAAYLYGRSMSFSPAKLLLDAGADRNIADRFGRKPKEMRKIDINQQTLF